MNDRDMVELKSDLNKLGYDYSVSDNAITLLQNMGDINWIMDGSLLIKRD